MVQDLDREHPGYVPLCSRESALEAGTMDLLIPFGVLVFLTVAPVLVESVRPSRNR